MPPPGEGDGHAQLPGEDRTDRRSGEPRPLQPGGRRQEIVGDQQQSPVNYIHNRLVLHFTLGLPGKGKKVLGDLTTATGLLFHVGQVLPDLLQSFRSKTITLNQFQYQFE